MSHEQLYVRACELTCTAVQTNSVVLLGRRNVDPGVIHGCRFQASATMIASNLTASTSTWRARTRGCWATASGTDYLFQVRSDANLINALADDHSKVTEEEEHVCLTIVAVDDVRKRWLGQPHKIVKTFPRVPTEPLVVPCERLSVKAQTQASSRNKRFQASVTTINNELDSHKTNPFEENSVFPMYPAMALVASPVLPPG
jgi:hypothetical protein